MSDNNDRSSLFAHTTKNIEQSFCFLRRKNGCRFIKNEKLSAMIQHFNNFNSLLFTHRHRIYFLIRIKKKSVLFFKFIYFNSNFFLVKKKRRTVTKHNVF